MKGASQLVAALSLHGFYLCVMESMEGQMLHFTVVLVVKVEKQSQLNDALVLDMRKITHNSKAGLPF